MIHLRFKSRVRRAHLDADPWTVYSSYNTMGSGSIIRKQKRFECDKVSSVPEDEDTLEEGESGDSLTVDSAS